ncbi:JM72 [macacine gammaherpesvirus 11]|uniref:JM72 n=2 Tax=macacine gammaherpesvirus 11 TaxID=2560570 RepID=G9JMQ0_9GAMA|nr:JM72 [Macaca fuscata rhadinovirus]AAT00049.1 JM72 [Macaca fuscata rhadinovirus]AEW87597.1 JM72 [Macaca fuscata rhadinovirus]AEW87767.1 JM72 [Macaca fuscata rhadinovirus]
MFKMNPGLGSTCLVHPTELSISLFEILQGKYAYVRGQTLHSSLRNPGIFGRQLFIHLYKTALGSCTYDNVLKDWTNFETTLKTRWRGVEHLTPEFKRSTFESWARTVRLTVDQLLLNTINQVLHTRTVLSYERYVDWVVALGLVPIVRRAPDGETIARIQAHCQQMRKTHASGDVTISRIVDKLAQEITAIMTDVTSIYIPDYAEVSVEFNGDKAAYLGTYRQKDITVEVVSRPIIYNGRVSFDSPLYRLFTAIMTCHRTAEHAKLCQLLNTAPLKALVGSTCNDMYKDILARLEQSSQKTDPKRELLNLLIKLAENKTVSGITDVVEDFVTDVSQNIVDKNKLFGTGTESTTQGLRKQVSNTVFKCLTNQINEQFDTISNLEKERDDYVKKIQCIETQLLQSLPEGGRPRHDINILTQNTLQALSGLRDPTINLSECHIPKGSSVVNSFFSQYVPPFMEMLRELTSLWEGEMFQTYNLTPVVDNQGQRTSIAYSQDTVSILLGPFTYIIAKLTHMDLINHSLISLSLHDIADQLYVDSRLFVYINDIGHKYCEQIIQPGTDGPNTEAFNGGAAPIGGNNA